jgi:solute carrier family 25 folate transporter 32
MIGISNGAIQFMTYEHLKRWGKDRKRRLRGETGHVGEVDLEQLVSRPVFDIA